MKSRSHRMKVAPHAATIDRVSSISSSSSRELLALVSETTSDLYIDLVAPQKLAIVPTSSPKRQHRQSSTTSSKLVTAVRSLLGLLPSPLLPLCNWLSFSSLSVPAPLSSSPSAIAAAKQPSSAKLISSRSILHRSSASSSMRLGSRVIGTLFGHRRGHVRFAVQDDPRAVPVLLLELATPTSSLVKEMASGLVRIALECEKRQGSGKILMEQMWTMYCNGRRVGYAIKRMCCEEDLQVLELVQAVSTGAGMLPTMQGPGWNGSGMHTESDLMFMRAKFERVVGSKDSEAFYMINPDSSVGPELSIFLLRI